MTMLVSTILIISDIEVNMIHYFTRTLPGKGNTLKHRIILKSNQQDAD